MITCIIRYHIDPNKKAEFEQYARNWGQTIPRCGADLVGYFAPHEGSTTLAYGIYSVENLAAYEQYRSGSPLTRSAARTTNLRSGSDFYCARIARSSNSFSAPHTPLVKL